MTLLRRNGSPRRVADEALPPGPRMPRALQTAIWSRHAQWMLSQCQRRYGDTFRLDIAYEGTWIFLTDPEDVKRVFTGDPNLLHAGEANRILLPVVGEHSVLLLDESAHLEQRKLMLPSFHGERMRRYVDLMSDDRRRRDRALAARRAVRAASADAGRDARDHPPRRLRRDRREAARAASHAAPAPARHGHRPQAGDVRARARAGADSPLRAVPPRDGPGGSRDLRRDQRSPRRRGPRRARGHPVAAAAGAARGRLADERSRAPRRARHPPRRRARDHRDRARLGRRAAGPPPRQARSPDRGGPRGLRGLPEGGGRRRRFASVRSSRSSTGRSRRR